MNKQIHAKGDDDQSEDCQHVMTIINCPLLCLRGSFGFVNKSPSGALSCKSSVPECVPTSQGADGHDTHARRLDHLGQPRRRQWRRRRAAPRRAPSLKESKVAVKCDGKCLTGKQTGEILFDGASIGPNGTWEH